MNDKALKQIAHERTLLVIFNYAYEVIGQGLVSDGIYEYGVSRLKELMGNHPEEWASSECFKDYFTKDNDWVFTGSHSPKGEEVETLYADMLKRIGK